MEFLRSANEINPLKLRGVIISNDESSSPFDIEPSDLKKVLLMSLDEMREYLCQESLILIGRQNTNFRNAFKNKIPLAREPECKLKDILIPLNEDAQDGSYSFYLEKDLRRPGFPEIVNRLRIDYGYKKNNGNIESANEKAFRVRRPHMMDVITEQKLEQHNAEVPGRKLLIVKKGSIRLLQEDLEPTQEYIDAVENALNEPDNQRRREALNAVGEEYGSKEILLGGKLYVDNAQANNLTDLENLKLFENWQIIEHNELLSLYNLLPQKLILRIKEVIGMKLLYCNILSIDMQRKCCNITQLINKPQEISTFKDVKIFASVVVMNNKTSYRNVFGIRIDYQNDESPYIVVTRIGPAKHHFKLSIPWMLIGYVENLPIGPIENDPIDYISLNFDHCWLGTCVLNSDDNTAYEFGKNKNVMSYHFRNTANNNTQICCYKYDLQTDRISNTLKFKVNCAVIPAAANFQIVGPDIHTWKYRPCRLQYVLTNSRTYTGNRWQLPNLPNAIFASIYYANSPDHSLFLNLHKKYPIVKSLTKIRENFNALVGYVIVSNINKINTKENINQENTRNISSQPINNRIRNEEDLEYNFSSINNESLQHFFNENFFKLNHGLIISSQIMCVATNAAFNIKINPKNYIIKSCAVNILSSKSKRETFLLENNINSGSFQLLPSKFINIMTQSANILSDNSPVDDICLEIKCQKIILNFERESIQPTEIIKTAVNNALQSQRPYQELIKVFNLYGYILSQKIILGEKLYEMSYYSLQETPDHSGQQLELKESFEIDLSELDELFALWKNKYRCNATYVMSLCGEAVKKDHVKKWIDVYYKQDFKTLQIINRDELFPLYEIFEESIRHEIESILGIKNEENEKILMTGITQIIENTKYYHVSFPVRLNSSNYQIFAKIVRTNKRPNSAIDTAFVIIQSATKTGFLAIIENFDKIRNIDPTELQIIWMLVGLPNEINFFSTHTRKLSVLNMKHQEVESDKKSILLEIPDNCPETSILALSFEFLLNCDKSTNQKHQIKLNIESDVCSEDKLPESNEPESDDDSSNISEESQEHAIKYSLYSCIFVLDKDDFIEADISPNENKFIHLKIMGLTIS
ncbi:1251_t:CDS:2 [Racocetra persica]|uniref:1251_t:CDS:1 n=1 Tax=Racocetra persica TaxID=160502 RepID=A0ACA9KF77_9GLOM|nr:1251_t:CDS:2 [Racocetra persica]